MPYGEVNITEEIERRQSEINELQDQINALNAAKQRIEAIHNYAEQFIRDPAAENDYNKCRADARQIESELFRKGILLKLDTFPEHWKIK